MKKKYEKKKQTKQRDCTFSKTPNEFQTGTFQIPPSKSQSRERFSPPNNFMAYRLIRSVTHLVIRIIITPMRKQRNEQKEIRSHTRIERQEYRYNMIQPKTLVCHY